MNIAIRYYTKFGHSAKMANVISQVTGSEAETIASSINKPVDILFLGSGVLLGKNQQRHGKFYSYTYS